MLTFDTYTASAPRASDRWATSDRGWMHDSAGNCIGFYLAYPANAFRTELEVLAEIYTRPISVTGRVLQPTRHLSATLATVEEARAWMTLHHAERGTE